MPVFFVHCDLSGVENVDFLRPGDLKKRLWGVHLRCTKCQELHGQAITIDPTAEVELEGGGTATFTMACRACKHRFSVTVVQPSAKELDTWVWANNKKPSAAGNIVAAFDVRGADLESIEAGGEWVALNQEHDICWRFSWSGQMAKDGGWSEYEEALQGLATIEQITLTAKRG
jgi:hypothetical protein